MIQTNQYNHLTAKERETLSFPAKLLFNKCLLAGDVLDFGCGFGKDVELLKGKGLNVVGYDKHYFPKYPAKKFPLEHLLVLLASKHSKHKSK